MSEFTILMRRCDLTGEEAPADSGKIESVPFALDGVDYDIHLVASAAAELREAYSDYIEHGRRTGRMARPARKAPSGPATTAGPKAPSAAAPTVKTPTKTIPRDPEQTRAIRRWAREVGYGISDRGRIPGFIAEHYRETGGRTAGVEPRVAVAAGA